MITPMAILVLWTCGFYLFNLLVRLKKVKAGEIDAQFFKVMQGDAPEIIIRLNRHMTNLFEAPVLFYAGCLAVTALKITDPLFVALGFAYVILRIVHTYVHISKNRIRHRMPVFVTGHVCLVIVWVRILIHAAQAGL